MTLLVVWLIEVYQRWVSPYKGFHCAHHHLHQTGTCSNAVKQLVVEKGVLGALPFVRQRVQACRQAYQVLSCSPTELACDMPCDVSFGDCGGGSTGASEACILPCELVAFAPSRRARRSITVGLLILGLICAYWFYGRAVDSVILSRVTDAPTGFFDRLKSRQEPDLRVLIKVGNKKYYSEVQSLQASQSSVTLHFNSGPLVYDLTALEVHDARFNVAGELVVIGQVLESIKQPSSMGKGERFNYRIKRRWHFF